MALGDYAALANILDFPCETEGHDAAFAEMARRLRASDTIQPLLRQRLIETSIESRSQIYWLRLFERILPPVETTP